MSESAEVFFVLLCFGIGYFLVTKFFPKNRQSDQTKVNKSREKRNESSQQSQESKRTDREHKSEKSSASSQNVKWYQVLGVNENSTQSEIRKAYLVKMQAYHPDKVATLAPEFRALAEEKTKEINSAYQLAQRLKR